MPDGEGWGFGQKCDWGLGAVWDVRWAGEDRAKVAKEPKVKRVERMCMVEEVWDGWELVIYFALNVPLSFWQGKAAFLYPNALRVGPLDLRRVMTRELIVRFIQIHVTCRAEK